MEYVYKGVKYNRIIIRSDRFSKPVRSKTKQNKPENPKESREWKVKSGQDILRISKQNNPLIQSL